MLRSYGGNALGLMRLARATGIANYGYGIEERLTGHHEPSAEATRGYAS